MIQCQLLLKGQIKKKAIEKCLCIASLVKKHGGKIKIFSLDEV
jgi:hypothetical protein